MQNSHNRFVCKPEILNQGAVSMGSSLPCISFLSCNGAGGPPVSTITTNNAPGPGHCVSFIDVVMAASMPVPWKCMTLKQSRGHTGLHSGVDRSPPTPDLLLLPPSEALLEPIYRVLMLSGSCVIGGGAL